MAFGDWAPGSMLRPLRSIVEYDPQTGTVAKAVLEGEVYSPSGIKLTTLQFPWIPRTVDDAITVQTIGTNGFVDIMTAEGLSLFGAPPPSP